MIPGAPCLDAPVDTGTDGQSGWLLDHLKNDSGGTLFYGLYFIDPADDRDLAAEFAHLKTAPIPIRTLFVTQHADNAIGFDGLIDSKGRVNERYDGKSGTYYLIRPDQHVAGRWRRFEPNTVRQALRRATGHTETKP